MIDGAIVQPLKVLPDDRGRLMEILRSDADFYQKFGQVYMTTAYPGVVKGWHFHKVQWDHFAVVHGMMKLVLYDRREESPTHGEVNEFFMGVHNPILVRIPPGVLHGFSCVGDHECIVINIPTETYNYTDPDEFRVAPDDPSVPYDWYKKKDR